MRHLLVGVATAALLGLGAAAMAQQSYQGGAPVQSTPGAPAGAIQGDQGAGKEAIKNQRESTAQSGATVGTPSTGSSTLGRSDTMSAPNKGAAAGTKGTGSGMGTTYGTGSTSSGTGTMTGTGTGTTAGSGATMSQGRMTTRDLNLQELERLRAGSGS